MFDANQTPRLTPNGVEFCNSSNPDRGRLGPPPRSIAPVAAFTGAADLALLDEATAARMLGVKPGTLRNWRFRRIGPAYVKIGRRPMYRPRALDAWLDRRTVKTGDETIR